MNNRSGFIETEEDVRVGRVEQRVLLVSAQSTRVLTVAERSLARGRQSGLKDHHLATN